MKNTTKILGLIILFSASLFSNCKKDEPKELPIIEFSYVGENQPAPVEVAFINTTTNATSYMWDFGDGGTATDQHPKHTFEEGGIYTVNLTATGAGGSTSSSKSITIIEKVTTPIADFSIPEGTYTAPAEIIFENLSTNAETFSWEFGDSKTSTETNPKHTYISAGTFSVKLTATKGDISNSTTKSVVIEKKIVAPVAVFAFTGNYGYAPAEISFTNYSTDATSYKWEFGDGATSTSSSPKHIYTTGGTFTATLTATGEGGTNTMTKNVTIKDALAKPVANFSFSGDNNFAPTQIIFSNSSSDAASYYWEFGDGQTSTLQNPTHIYTAGGIFNVTLTAKNTAGDMNIINKTITIKNKPTKLKITSMVLTAMPFNTPTGGGWDNSNGPDVYLLITDSNSINYYESNTNTDVLQSQLPLSYSTGLPISMSDFTKEYIIRCVDYDFPDSDDIIGGYIFTINDWVPASGSYSYPTSLSFQNSTSELKFTLYVEWVQ